MSDIRGSRGRPIGEEDHRKKGATDWDDRSSKSRITNNGRKN